MRFFICVLTLFITLGPFSNLEASGKLRVGLIQMNGKILDKSFSLDLEALRKERSAWNPVYGPANRYPKAYKRIREQP
jgi:hypothetical protein